jgi:iron complex transport system permease protein
MISRKKSVSKLLLISFFFIGVVIFTPFIGSQSLDFHDVIYHFSDLKSPDSIIFFQIRFPRVILALITGASLSLAGVVFQAILRNPLATPYTLGVSAGGAFGAVLVIKSGITLSILGFSTIQTSAFAGSLLTILLVYYLAQKSGRISVQMMILAGVTISYFFGAAILMLHFLADFTETQQMVRWMMGGLDVVDQSTVLRALPLLIIAYIVILIQSRPLNIISTSEEIAISKGVSVSRVQKTTFILASLITGLVVAVSGPIGFVGLIVPHLLRLYIGIDHRFLIPASILFGAAFLALCDTFARTIIAPVDIPVGIITAIIGGPFFLWMLVKRG